MPERCVLAVLEDQAIAREAVESAADRQGFRVVVRGGAEDPVRVAREERATLVLAAAQRWEGSLARLLRDLPSCAALALVGGAAPARWWPRALGAGVVAVLTSPIDPAELGRALEERLAWLARRRSLLTAELAAADHFGCGGLVGRGPAMQAVFERARRVAPWLHAALIVGEPGTGKLRLARALHALGPRSTRAFVVVGREPSAGGLDLGLFGPEPGEINGAGAPGLIEVAEGGVLYVADLLRLSARGQQRLLAAIGGQAHGAAEAAARPDLVVIAGATRHPRADAASGRVADALVEALSEVEFQLPPLRQRREDLAGLAAVFLREAAAQSGRAAAGLTPDAEALLHEAFWPGNLAQLRATIERACLLADAELLGAREVAAALPAERPAASGEDGDDGSQPLSTVEREHILRALQRAGGNKKAAARVLGVSRRALYRKLERLDLGSTIARRPRDGAGHELAGPASAEAVSLG